MRVGDRLLAVDGVPVTGRTVDQACSSVQIRIFVFVLIIFILCVCVLECPCPKQKLETKKNKTHIPLSLKNNAHIHTTKTTHTHNQPKPPTKHQHKSTKTTKKTGARFAPRAAGHAGESQIPTRRRGATPRYVCLCVIMCVWLDVYGWSYINIYQHTQPPDFPLPQTPNPKQKKITGEDGIELTLTRRLVRVPDVKLTSFLGPPTDGIGYIQLTSFSQVILNVFFCLDLKRGGVCVGGEWDRCGGDH